MSAPQYSNSGKYTTYMHITIINLRIISCLSLRFFYVQEKVMEEKNWWIFIFMAKKRPFLPLEQANKTSPRFHPGQTSALTVQPSPAISEIPTLFCPNFLIR